MMTPNEKHYWELSEVYIAHYEKHMQREDKIMIAKGATIEMFSELVEWRQKNESNERFEKLWSRLQLIQDALEVSGSLSSTNIQFRRILSSYKQKMSSLEAENTDLKKQVEVLTKTIEHEK
jgi:hypothetical protein